ncbi:HAMP domain-containing sensor histidine kinase [Actinomadura sp. 3N407]|uniref:HAMP domain-containing sensor histidine kinase n=1 Tax=Actinomadura sp. 3N407 TaxID=3457423 RepID=UPI003FCD5B50
MAWRNIGATLRRTIRPPGGADQPGLSHSPTARLFWRIFAGNGVIFAVGLTVLALSPATVSSPVLLAELPVLAAGLALMLAINAAALRNTLSPLDQLAPLAERVSALRLGERLPAGGDGDIAHLVATLNAMLDRLQADRTSGAALALAAQETERRRIAQELHDEIGQTLTVALLEMKRALDHAPHDLHEPLHNAQETVRTSLDEVRQVARRLRPGVLDDLGLLSALTALANDFSKAAAIPVHRRLDPALPPLDDTIELVIYRIAQEALTNIARHAHADTAQLSLTRHADNLVLEIGDDGNGPPIREGAGIHGMRERAALVGGRLTLRPAPHSGLQVVLTVPLPAEPEPAP